MLRRLCTGLLIVPLLAAAFACGGGGEQRIHVRIGRLDARAEQARTPEERALGLSGRAALAQDVGMLFIFPQEGQPAFWMKGMRFPLDFIWISADGRVVDLTENVPPPAPGTADGDLTVYQPSGSVLYVLEVNAGVVAATSVHVGDTVAFDPPPPAKGVR